MNDEKQYRKQKAYSGMIESDIDMDERKQLDEALCRKKLKTTNYNLPYGFDGADEKAQSEMEGTERQYKAQIMQNHGVSKDECHIRIDHHKKKDWEEYESVLNAWKKRKKEDD